MQQAGGRKRRRKARADGSTAACWCLRRRWRKRRAGCVACRGGLRDSRRFGTCANAGRGSHACAATSAASPRRNQRNRQRGRRTCWAQLDGCGGAGAGQRSRRLGGGGEGRCVGLWLLRMGHWHAQRLICERCDAWMKRVRWDRLESGAGACSRRIRTEMKPAQTSALQRGVRVFHNSLTLSLGSSTSEPNIGSVCVRRPVAAHGGS